MVASSAALLGALLVLTTAVPQVARAGEIVPLCAGSGCGWKVSQLPGNITADQTGLDSVVEFGGAVIAVGGVGTILRSTNGGLSYTQVPSPWQGVAFTTLAVDPFGDLWAGTQTDAFLISSDDGVSWTPTPSSGLSGNLSSLGFVTSTFAYATTSSGLFFSANDGQTWTLDPSLGTGWARAAAFDNTKDGWVDWGVSPSILYTTDGGASWTAGTIADSPAVAEEFIPTGTASAWYLGFDGSIYRTSNGLSWTLSDHPIGERAYGLALVNGTYLWEAAEDGNVLYSPNDGGCWIEQPVPSIPDLSAVAFRDANHGVVVGSGQAFYTTDGGSGITSNYSSISSAEPGPTLGATTSVGVGGSLRGIDSDDGPLPPCTAAPPYSIDVLATAAGTGIGVGVVVGIRSRPRTPEGDGGRTVSESDTTMKRQRRRTHYHSSRKRYLQT